MAHQLTREDFSESAVDRFLALCATEVDENGCVRWQGAHSRHSRFHDRGGYGMFRLKVEGRWTTQYAHRVAYVLAVGPIPVEFELDHHCETRDCVAPWHLEAVTAEENKLRIRQPWRRAALAQGLLHLLGFPVPMPADPMNRDPHPVLSPGLVA